MGDGGLPGHKTPNTEKYVENLLTENKKIKKG